MDLGSWTLAADDTVQVDKLFPATAESSLNPKP